jgi:dienelactone hydrolase
MRQRVVDRWPVREGGLVGTFFRPSTPGPHPAVIVLGGSDGGLREGSAAVIARQGYATLALAYFGVGPLPPELVEVPVEGHRLAESPARRRLGAYRGHGQLEGG